LLEQCGDVLLLVHSREGERRDGDQPLLQIRAARLALIEARYCQEEEGKKAFV